MRLSAGTYELDLSDAGDWVSAFVNGVHAASSAVQQRQNFPVARFLKVTLKEGDNPLALLAAHYGRAKLHAYIGPMDEIDKKGVSGPVMLDTGPAQTLEIKQFRWQADDRGIRDARRKAAPGLDISGHGLAGRDHIYRCLSGAARLRLVPGRPAAHSRPAPATPFQLH